jgi:hypothetical protein
MINWDSPIRSAVSKDSALHWENLFAMETQEIISKCIEIREHKMNGIIKILVLTLALSTLFSCGNRINKKELEREVKQAFQKELDTDYKKYGMKVQKIILVKSGSYSYDGLVTVLFKDKTHDISISVTIDGGDSYIWSYKPLEFNFLP